MSVFRNLDCFSFVVCSNFTETSNSVVFIFFQSLRFDLSIDAAYTRTFTVDFSIHDDIEPQIPPFCMAWQLRHGLRLMALHKHM